MSAICNVDEYFAIKIIVNNRFGLKTLTMVFNVFSDISI